MSSHRLSFVAFATLSSLSFALSIGARARAQDVLLDVKSPVVGAAAEMGIAIGDWDGDGTADLAIGAPSDGTVAVKAGAVRVHSGKNGSILASFYGVNTLDMFGQTLARMPDLNGDGIDDLAVAAWGADHSGTDTGSIFVYAGRTGAFLFRSDGPAGNVFFGRALGPISDVDGDGIPDLHASCDPSDGLVEICSGADGHVIQTLNGVQGEYFGSFASAIDDLDGDGVQELLAGAMYHVNSSGMQVGAAYVVSPVTGAILRTHAGTFNKELLGTGTAALADLDGDGVHDYAVSAYFDDTYYASKVVVFSGASGSQIGKIASASKLERVGTQIAAGGDLNGDGVGDLAIGGSWIDTRGFRMPAAFLVSGKTLLTLDRIDLTDGNVVVAPFGDLNSDGLDDLIVGSLNDTFDGEVRIYSGDDLWLEGTPNDPSAGDVVELDTREGAPGTLTILALVAIDATPTFLLVGGVQSFGPTGGSKLIGTLPSGLSGHDFTFRAYANGPAGKVISSATQAIHCQ